MGVSDRGLTCSVDLGQDRFTVYAFTSQVVAGDGVLDVIGLLFCGCGQARIDALMRR